METIEELKRQREEIDRKIKELEVGSKYFGFHVKMDKTHYTGGRRDEWYLAVKLISPNNNACHKIRWMSIIREYNRKDILDKIDPIINDLQMAKRFLEEEDTP